MGFLDTGDTLSWDEVVLIIDYVKRHGLKQLIHIFERDKNRSFDTLKWGDEVEYVVVVFDDDNKRVRLCLRAPEILSILQEAENEAKARGTEEQLPSIWRPEYGSFMIEGTPGWPYGGRVEDLLVVQDNMAQRRKEVQRLLQGGEVILCLTHFPLMGVDDFTLPAHPVCGPVARSLFVPDQVINPHPRFATLTQNIRARRGRKVDINVPIFLDSLTKCPPQESSFQLPGHVYMDAMAFGMGSSCVQCTFQCCNLDEARMFYDCFVPMAPIMLALTANCPAFRGWLVDTDCRWDIISASVDSRRDEELPAWRSRAFGDKDEEELDQVNDAVRSNHLNGSEKSGNGWKNVYEGSGKRIHDKLDPNDDSREKGNVNVEKIPARRTGEKIGESGGSYYGRMGKSRYGSVSLYIGNSNKFNEKYNDVDVNVNTWVYNKLQKAGFDNVLARHFAHLFIQDPLVVYRGKVQMDDATHTDHFENIQSTNWQTVRFKPPPPNSGIGWRVEFRSMELQFHDFENAAYVIFIALITRVLTQFQLNLYMPISAVDANMARAQRRNAVLDQRFYWRKNLLGTNAAQSADDSMVELTVNEIINGSQASGFIGLIPLVNRYLDTKLTSPEVKEKIGVYLQFISDRASGKLLTGAAFQRRFILNHPLYKRDSRLTNEIAYDLLKEVQKVQASENPLSFYKA